MDSIDHQRRYNFNCIFVLLHHLKAKFSIVVSVKGLDFVLDSGICRLKNEIVGKKKAYHYTFFSINFHENYGNFKNDY